jgi:hypothetical protein
MNLVKSFRLLGATTLALASSLAFAGFSDLAIKSTLSGRYVLGIAVHDQRFYVLNGETQEKEIGKYVGGVFRTRKPVETDSGSTAATEIAEGLSRYFQKQKWLAVASFGTSAKMSDNDINGLIKTAKLRRSMVVTIKDIWCEAYRNTSVNFEFEISVKDDKAQTLATFSKKGVHDTSQWGSEAVAELFGPLMTEALDTPEFIAALKD